MKGLLVLPTNLRECFPFTVPFFLERVSILIIYNARWVYRRDISVTLFSNPKISLSHFEQRIKHAIHTTKRSSQLFSSDHEGLILVLNRSGQSSQKGLLLPTSVEYVIRIPGTSTSEIKTPAHKRII